MVQKLLIKNVISLPSKNIHFILQNQFEFPNVIPAIISRSAIAAHNGNEFSFCRQLKIICFWVIKGDRPAIRNWNVAVGSVGHGPVEETVVVEETLVVVEKRIERCLVREEDPSLLVVPTTRQLRRASSLVQVKDHRLCSV